MTRQTKWKIKNFQSGNCVNCGFPRGKSPYKRRCITCAIKQRVRHEKKFGSKPWTPGTPGRPPMVKMRVNKEKVNA